MNMHGTLSVGCDASQADYLKCMQNTCKPSGAPLQLMQTCSKKHVRAAKLTHKPIKLHLVCNLHWCSLVLVHACACRYGVGGLSVLNACAGCYSEDLPVIFVSGGPGACRGLLCSVCDWQQAMA